MSGFVRLRGGRLFDPAPRGRADLLLAGGRIALVADDLSGLVIPGLETVDLDGLLVLPGLVDAHVHLGGGGGEGGFATRAEAPSPAALRAAGVTTAVGVLGTDGVTRSLADLLARARALAAWGINGWMYTGSYHLPVPTLTGSVQSDLVIVDKVIGVGELAVGDHRSSQPSRDELARVAADARVGGMLAGKPAPLQLHLGDDPAGLALLAAVLDSTSLPAGQFWPTHLNRHAGLLPPALALIARGVPFDLTAGFVDSGDELSAAACLGRLRAAGVGFGSLSLSSDSGGSMPVFDAEGRLAAIETAPADLLIKELRLCLEAGFGLEDILPLATCNPADRLGLADVGRLAPGCRADLIVCDERLAIREVWASGQRHPAG